MKILVSSGNGAVPSGRTTLTSVGFMIEHATTTVMRLLSDSYLGDDQTLSEGADQIPMLIVPTDDPGFWNPCVMIAATAEE